MASRHAPIQQEAVVTAFRQLSEEHTARRLSRGPEEAWTRLQVRRIVATLPHRNYRIFGWIAAAAVAATVTLFALQPSSSPLEYEVRGAEEAEGLITTSGHPATVAFSDGSVIEATGNTTLAVALRGSHGALARLSSGTLKVNVDHGDDTDWRFIAGPYEVVVVGTRFDLAWNPEELHFRLALHEGQVRVLGDDIGVRTVNAGEVLEVQAKPSFSAATDLPPAQAVEEIPSTGDKPADSPKSRLPSSARHVAPTQSWSRLVAEGRFEDVVRAAEAVGLGNVEATRDVTELKALAQAAHYAGRTDVSLRIWRALRRRFPSSSASRQAAFFLARIYEQGGQNASARQWLDLYMEESPNGVYASEALGRKLVLISRTSGTAAARPSARKYLKLYPTGPYSQTARDMLRAD